jgi:hypothetical protein
MIPCEQSAQNLEVGVFDLQDGTLAPNNLATTVKLVDSQSGGHEIPGLRPFSPSNEETHAN